jgi:hypothetical protein
MLIGIVGTFFAQWTMAQVTMPLGTYLIWRGTNEAASVIASGIQYYAQKQRINENLRVARERYWRELPKGAGLEAARKAYAEALLMKDFTNGDKAIVREELMDLQIGGGMAGKAAAHAQQRLTVLENLTGGAIEDTHPYAQQEFNTWVSAFVTEKLRTNDIRKAFLKTAPLYDKYALVRDRAEYLFLYPNSPLFSDEISTQIIALLSTCKYIGAKDAARSSAELKRSVADHSALKAAGITAARRMKEEAGKLGEYTANVSNPDASICAAPALLYSELGLPNPYSKLVRQNASAASDFKIAVS